MPSSDPRHDPYRHLRANLRRHRSLTGFRTVKVWCDVCGVFEPDETGRCPLCQPPATGDLVGDLLAERAGAAPAPTVTDQRLHAAGLLTGEWEDGAA